MANILLYIIDNRISLYFELFGEKKIFEDVTLKFGGLLTAFFHFFLTFYKINNSLTHVEIFSGLIEK